MLLAAAFLAFTPASLHAKEVWRQIQTSDLTVIGNVSPKTLNAVAAKLDVHRQVTSLIFPRASRKPPVPITAVVFDDSDSLRPYAPRLKGKPKAVAGYVTRGIDRHFVVLGLGYWDTDEVVFHEMQHVFLHNNLGHLPAWFDEGFADLLSSVRVQSGGRKVVLGAPIDHRVRTLRSSTLIPVSRLLMAGHNSPYYNDRDKQSMFYAQSWALVHFLFFREPYDGARRLAEFLSQLRSDVPPETAYRQVFGAELSELDRQLSAYIRGGAIPGREFTLAEPLSRWDKEPVVEMEETEARLLLGDLVPRGPEAVEYFSGILKATPNNAMAHAGMARALLHERKLAEAEVHTLEAVRLDPGLYRAHLLHGYVLRDKGDWEGAIRQMQTAASLRPDAVEPLLVLSLSLIAAGRMQESIAPFDQAYRLEPTRSDLFSTKAFFCLRLGQGAYAAAAARQFLGREGWTSDAAPYMALAAYFGHLQAKQASDASSILSKALATLDAKSWPYPLLQYLAGQIDRERVMQSARDEDQRTEAHAYVGMHLAVRGERDAALEHLRWVRDNGRRDFVEYDLANSEIGRLLEADAVK